MIKGAVSSGKGSLFFKQWGGFRKKKAGRELQGKTWDQMPSQYWKPRQCGRVGVEC